MTFSEYFNSLYKPLKDEEKKADFFDAMLKHYMDEDAYNGCALLNVDSETKPRYVRENNPNPIKADNAKYVYAHRTIRHDRYANWINERIADMEAYEVIENWLIENKLNSDDPGETCYKLLTNILYEIGFPKNNEKAIFLPPEEKCSDDSETGWSEHDNMLVADFNSDYDEVIQICIGERYAQEYITGRLAKNVNALYRKWEGRTIEFENILLRSDILAILGTLQELCDALNPDRDAKAVRSIRMIRTELRNLYVKLHPSNYIGIGPYEAFIDDWNDTEEHFEFEL